MATWSQGVQIDRLFKWMFNKARGDSNGQYYEENIPTTFDVHASDIYSQAISQTPPANTTSVVKKWYTSAEGGDGWITLTRDKKYNGGRVWVALGTWSNNWSSGSGDVTQIMKNFISPKYGKGYLVQIFDGSGNQIPELDASSWLFDYKAGVLTFETDRTETGSTSTDCIKIKVYQYTGATLSQASAAPAPRHVEVFTIAADADVETNYTLAQAPYGAEYIDVFLNGVLLNNIVSNDYIITNKVLTLQVAIFKDDVLIVKYQ